jgi:hypothetical protein
VVEGARLEIDSGRPQYGRLKRSNKRSINDFRNSDVH